jgi:hypothetical protein
MTVSLGCIHDDVRSKPGSWIPVAMILIFDTKTLTRRKLHTEDCPQGADRQRIEITHRLGVLEPSWKDGMHCQ